MDLVYFLHLNAITPLRGASIRGHCPLSTVHCPLSTPTAIMVRGAMSARTTAPPMTDLAARVRDVSFSYAVPGGGERLALDGLTLDVPSGAVFGLLGPNGSGKSTLLSLLAGLRQPSAGEVRVRAQPPSTAMRARIGLLFQETSLDPLMTCVETL